MRMNLRRVTLIQDVYDIDKVNTVKSPIIHVSLPTTPALNTDVSQTPTIPVSVNNISLAPPTIAVVPTSSVSSKDMKLAYGLLWFTFILFFAGTGFGKLWDRVWHLTHKFETFFSPPHEFIISITTLTGIIALTLAFSPRFRSCFGLRTYVPFLKREVAGSITIMGAGLICLSLAIVMDSIWHTAFGLDETMWSLPHDMLPLSWCVIILGFVASRLAMRAYKPIDWLTKLVFAVLILCFLCPPILGPFYLNYSISLLHAFSILRINEIQPTIEHTYRIYITAQLSRQSSPLFIPLVTFFAGIAIVLLHQFNVNNKSDAIGIDAPKNKLMALLRWADQKVSIELLAPIIWSLVFMGRDIYTVWFVHYDGLTKIRGLLPILLKEPSLWVPIPLLVASVIFLALEKTRMDERWKWMLNGAVFALITFCIWHTSIWMILLIIPAAPIMFLGSRVGYKIYSVLEAPHFKDILRILLVSNAQVPAVLGIADLILRRTIS